MQELALVPGLPKGPRGLPDMRRLAKWIVNSMPMVQAAILFGSRARRTARRDSDWDVALLAPERYKGEVLRTVPRVPDVSFVSLSPRRLRVRQNWLGTLERSVARDGVVLAGEWNMPRSLKKTRVSYPAMFRRLSTAVTRAQAAYFRLVMGKIDHSGDVDNDLSVFTQDAAEFTSKAALLHLGVDAPETHDVDKLADALSKKHPRHAWVSAISSFNGMSLMRHVAGYEDDDEDIGDVQESEDRLCRVLKFHEEVLEDIARKRPGFRGEMENLCNKIIIFVSDVKSDRRWKLCPEAVQHSLLSWEQRAQKVLENYTGERSD